MFLKCTNLSCGAWKFQEFALNQKTLKPYFKHIFRPKMQPFKVKKEKDKAFNKIMLIIGKIYRDLPVLKNLNMYFFQKFCQIISQFQAYHSHQNGRGGWRQS